MVPSARLTALWRPTPPVDYSPAGLVLLRGQIVPAGGNKMDTEHIAHKRLDHWVAGCAGCEEEAIEWHEDEVATFYSFMRSGNPYRGY